MLDERSSAIGSVPVDHVGEAVVGDLGDLQQRGHMLLGHGVVQPVPGLLEHLLGAQLADRDDQREAELLLVLRGNVVEGFLLVLAEERQTRRGLVDDRLVAELAGL